MTKPVTWLIVVVKMMMTFHSKKADHHGYRSSFEEKIAKQLDECGVEYEYEPIGEKISYTIPIRVHKYLPDFVLSNGIIIETKGHFTSSDRQKHLAIKAQHPELDIRFVFANPNKKLSKISKTTYAQWCKKYGFKFASKCVPLEWIEEKTEISLNKRKD